MLLRIWGAVGLMVITLIVIALSAQTEKVYVFPPVATTSTISVVPTKESEAPILPHTPPLETSTPTVSTKPVPAPTPIPAPTAKKPVVEATAPKPALPTQTEFDTTSSVLRGALVNILCLSGRQDIRSISGSGVIIDPRGIILTNAHIAQHFLYMSDTSLEVSCIVRAGSPARSMYQAKLMYLPQAWVTANKDILTTTNPKGSGEYDFALLAITGSASIPLQELPTIYPYIPLSTQNPSNGLPVVVGAYAGEFVSSEQIQSAFYPTVVFGTIQEVATYLTSTIDVVTISGSAASQSGSSGGGVARVPGELIGVITTSTREVATANRVLGSITASYIKRQYQAETSSTFEELLGKSPIEVASEFAPKIAELRAILTANISH